MPFKGVQREKKGRKEVDAMYRAECRFNEENRLVCCFL